MLYYKNIMFDMAEDPASVGGGGGGKVVVDYNALKAAELEEDLAQLTAAKEQMVKARAAAVGAVGGATNSVGKEVDAKLKTFDEDNFNLAIAEIQKIIDSMKIVGQSYEAAHAGLAADIAAIKIEGADDGSGGAAA